MVHHGPGWPEKALAMPLCLYQSKEEIWDLKFSNVCTDMSEGLCPKLLSVLKCIFLFFIHFGIDLVNNVLTMEHF